MVTSLRFWLITSFSIVLFICLLSIGLFVKSINDSQKIENYHSHLKITRILLLEINKLKEDILIDDSNGAEFYSPELSKPEQKFILLKKKTDYYLHYLEESKITKDYLLNYKIENIKKEFKTFNRIYDELIYLYKLKGFKNYGLEGKMRNHAHALYDYNNTDVKFYCLKLRRHEKDFLLRKDLSYVHEFNAVVRSFIEQINQNKQISDPDKNYLINQLYHYSRYFKILAQIETKIGVKGRNGQLNRSKVTFDKIAVMIEDLDNELKLIDEEQKENLKRDTFIILAILITFLITVIILLTRLISGSVKSISYSFSNYINSGFNFESILYKKSVIGEFNSIYLSFLKMAKEIHIFTNFFREKVHERTVAIHEQKEEILKQQLQIENQYKTLLNSNTELNEQKQLLALKNNDIHDSLRYAKRIQKALQPNLAKFKSFFPDSFIFSKARDVVSGDFYLTYKVSDQNSKEDKIVLVAGDCTGHGVPGAIMSVMGINILHKIIKELHNTDPATILKLLDKDIDQVFGHDIKHKNIISDGMDIAVFAFHKNSSILEYSVAKFPCLLVRDSELINLQTQKSSIGYNFIENDQKNFCTSSIQIKPGDCLYLFSDGLQDQFGGPFNKKYKKTNIKRLAQELHSASMHEQKATFKNEFKHWKRDLPQTDDVTVIGIRF